MLKGSPGLTISMVYCRKDLHKELFHQIRRHHLYRHRVMQIKNNYDKMYSMAI